MKREKQSDYKPGFVRCSEELRARHLSGFAVTDKLYRPTLRRASLCRTAYTMRGTLGRAALGRRFTRTFSSRCAQLGLSPADWWALTPPSHPYSVLAEAKAGRSFSSALIKPHGLLRIGKRDALCCPDFPPAPRWAASDEPSGCFSMINLIDAAKLQLFRHVARV